MSLKILSTEERLQFETLMDEACSEQQSTRLRVAAFLHKLADAIQAHQAWAGVVLDECSGRGAASLIKAHLKGRNRVLVAFNGVLVAKPTVVGVRRAGPTGEYVQQELIHVLTWDELRQKKKEYLTAVGSYTSNVAMVDLLLALFDLAPETATPEQAAAALGTTVEAWLKQGLAA
jgi:hypothetical protein